MKILVCGGRNYSNYEKLARVLSDFSPTAVVHGAASGADALAGLWCERNSIEQHKHPALWQKHGRAAGPIRNSEMLKLHPDIQLVVAFPGGTGTADMVRKSSKAGIPVFSVE